MKKYYSFFRIRFQTGLQYRTATIMGLITQLLWGLIECMAYLALHESNSGVFPMEFSALVSYIWLKEAFLVLFNTWAADNDIFSMIIKGDIAYELCRPLSVYTMWFSRNIGGRMSSALMRCIPILTFAFLLPEPYRLGLPKDLLSLCLFLLAMLLGLGVTVAFCMTVYMLAFFTISPQGLRMIFTGLVDILSGALLPLPFIPQPLRGILEVLPFASMHNVPLRIYTGDMVGQEMLLAICLQVFWLAVLIILGKLLYKLAERRIIVQGG